MMPIAGQLVRWLEDVGCSWSTEYLTAWKVEAKRKRWEDGGKMARLEIMSRPLLYLPLDHERLRS